MKIEEIKEKLTDVIVERLGVDKDEVSEKAVFAEDLCADSLDMVEVLIETERAFGIVIGDELWEGVCTVGDAIKVVDRVING